MKIQIENLKAQMQGKKLNLHQRADALIEFNKLVEYVKELKEENRKLKQNYKAMDLKDLKKKLNIINSQKKTTQLIINNRISILSKRVDRLTKMQVDICEREGKQSDQAKKRAKMVEKTDNELIALHDINDCGKYQGLFNLMANKYDLILIESEMDEIIKEAKKVVELSDTSDEIEKEEIVKRYETLMKADTTPVFLKEAVFKYMEEYAEYIAPKCECRKEWLSHRREYDQHPYGDNIEYDECGKCGEKHNFHCF